MTHVNWTAQRLSLSRLAFGCAPIMGRVGRRRALNALAMAFEAGVTHFDLARSYGFGEAERVAGRFLATRRGRVTITTKFGVQPQVLGAARRLAFPLLRIARNALPASRTLVRRASSRALQPGHYSLAEAKVSLDTSLRELGVDVIDLLLVHECSEMNPVHDDVIAWLQALRDQGKIRAWGFAAAGADADFYRARYRATDAVFQREMRIGDVIDPQARFIGHSLFALLGRMLGNQGAESRGIAEWAKSRGQRMEDLPSLLLETLLHSGGDCVVLCSMFEPEHIRSNTRCLTQPRSDAALRLEFQRLLAGRLA